MTPFELVEPASLGEAIALLDPDDAAVRPIAGGTALMLMMKAGVFRPSRLVSLRKLARLNARIAMAKDGALTIGAMTPLALLERSPEVARADPPSEIEAKIEGTPLGIVGRLTARSLTRLSEADDGGTKVSYEIDAALTGKLGSLGQPVLRAKAKDMERRFAERMRAAFADSQPNSETAT